MPGIRSGVGRAEGARPSTNLTAAKLTLLDASDRMFEVGRVLSAWLSGSPNDRCYPVSLRKGRGRAETLLLDLVRTGIENDFEQVVFPQYPELRDVKRVLGARGGGVCVAFRLRVGAVRAVSRRATAAAKAAARLRKQGRAGGGDEHVDAAAVLEEVSELSSF